MVIHDLNVFRAGIRPTEAYSKLVVHANAVLTRPISLELFKAISWWDAEVLEHVCNL
jgi:hypothetical protein